MSQRTVALLVLLLLVAGVAVALRTFTGEGAPDAASDVIATIRKPEDPPLTVAQPQHARVDDEARILAPFGPRVGRMADAFYEDLGIDVYIVTSTDAETSIELQADEVFQQRKIGAGAPTGGLLVILNSTLASARIEVGYSLEGVMTDLHMGRIARDQLAPYTSYGAAGMAVMDVLHHLRDHVYLLPR